MNTSLPKITLAMVMSVDGKTTHWHDEHLHTWTSKDDKKYFSTLIQRQRVVIMGRKTFLVARPHMKLSPDILRIVLTSHPEKYAALSVPQQLEFTTESAKELVSRLASTGCVSALLVGGSETNTAFFRADLIDEVWVTMEPVLFGCGAGLALEQRLSIDMCLRSITQLNTHGTLLLKYRVKKYYDHPSTSHSNLSRQ